jgi:hypothetical protein
MSNPFDPHTISGFRRRGERLSRTQDRLISIPYWLTFFSLTEARLFWRELATRSGFSVRHCRNVCSSNGSLNWIVCREALELKNEFDSIWIARHSKKSKAFLSLQLARKRAADAAVEVRKIERQIKRGVEL